MARIRKTVIGEFSGTIGNITFSRRGGLQIAHAKATIANPRSEAQQKHRGRFKQIQQFGSALHKAGLVRTFWKPYALAPLNAFNAFVKANSQAMPEAFDPARALLSKGNGLAPVVLSGVVQGSEPGTYVLRFDASAGPADDFIVGVLYNARTNEAVKDASGTTRAAGEVIVAARKSWQASDEAALFAYAFAYRPAADALRLSDSHALKVNGTAFTVPAPDVPPAAEGNPDGIYGLTGS